MLKAILFYIVKLLNTAQYCNKFTILSVLFADSILKKDFQAVDAARHFEAMPS